MKTVCILSLSRLSIDPRVRRQCKTFEELGYRVIVACLDSDQDNFLNLTDFKLLPERKFTFTSKIKYALRLLPSNLHSKLVYHIFWSEPYNQTIWKIAQHIQAELYIANDWPVLPFVSRLAEKNNAKFLYDSHELSYREKNDSLLWRVVFKKYIVSLESRYIPSADFISTVSPSIANELKQKYNISKPIYLIRNIPFYEASKYRSVKPPINVLYHGAFNEDRGLEMLIESVQYWKKEYHLTLRGTGNPKYCLKLINLIQKFSLQERISLKSSVPFEKIIIETNKADIGILPHPPFKNENLVCLPNKFFEYIMAGLAIVSTPLNDVQELFTKYDLGKIFSETTPLGIAKTLNELDFEEIDRYKEKSLHAAKELCWENEKYFFSKLIQLI